MAAWAGAAVRARPAVAAATAAVVRAFFGEAMRRMKETDTENLLRRGLWIARREGPRAVAVCVGAAARSGSCCLATSSREAGRKAARNDPFY
ncbi:hypothetical protein GCM10018980_61190 [Streptomyces capoamus]|uniref:Uncharacterized protein n=1 Tax=Streptomyces capoamus TaxID=68183 RepID=A0A919KEZ7_9ACTN|nr:hypothetical protein GCM10010501_46930 [Streptomyces libani subsp. rufus]GHG67951.1 hypothetical protein GCM10018980_61190 [Streptomyces capoamus]